jgi:hypothetical protein
MFASYRVVAAIPELISKGFISGTGRPTTLAFYQHALALQLILDFEGSILENSKIG